MHALVQCLLRFAVLPVLADELQNHVLCSAEVGTSRMTFLTDATNLAWKASSAQVSIALITRGVSSRAL